MQSSVEIELLDKKFSVSCSAEQKDGLLQSAKYLNGHLKDIQANTPTAGLMNNVLKLALNLSYELTTTKTVQQRAEFKINLLNATFEQLIDK
ncbi:cell division protein ZapA [Colwelliaceae bacterium BS250]